VKLCLPGFGHSEGRNVVSQKLDHFYPTKMEHCLCLKKKKCSIFMRKIFFNEMFSKYIYVVDFS
jgi:hypothetical protein